jgi:uncharacterized membrane protein
MNQPMEETKARKPVVLTVLGLITCVALVAMPFLAGPPSEETSNNMMRFLGRFHPVLLHLPIGMVTLAILMEFGSMITRRVSTTTRTTLFFASASSVVAVLAGFLLFQGESDWAESETANRHLWGGIIFSCVTILAFIVKAWSDAGASAVWFYRSLLLASGGVMAFASHDGASLTHGPDYLAKYAPPALKPLLGGKAVAEGDENSAAADPLVYANVVAPMLEEKCWKCHNEEKTKGKLRMDTYELLVKGGKEGPGLEPGKADESNIVIRCELPIDDDERMPPDEKPGLTPEQLTVIKWWINSGASNELKLSEANPPAEVAPLIKVSTAVSKAADPAEKEAAAAATADLGAKREEIKKSLGEIQKAYPGAVQFESQDSNGLTFTAVSMRGKFSDADFEKIGPVIGSLVAVDLSASAITDAALASLTNAKDLRSLRLSESKVTDIGMDHVAKLLSLESLNIYGTGVTDAGLQKLAALPKLKRLYVWQSKVTPAGIEELRKKLPGCVVEAGLQ